MVNVGKYTSPMETVWVSQERLSPLSGKVPSPKISASPEMRPMTMDEWQEPPMAIMFGPRLVSQVGLHSPKLTCPLKIDGWKM